VDAFFPKHVLRDFVHVTGDPDPLLRHQSHCLDSKVKNHFYFVKYHKRSAMTKQVSGRSLTADNRVQSQVDLRGICGAQSGIKTGLPPSKSILPS